jgi:hypothetical protein
MISDQPNLDAADGIVGTRDGFGAGDHDQPYRFGHRPHSGTTYPFSTRQYLRLLVLRGRIQDGDAGDGPFRRAA